MQTSHTIMMGIKTNTGNYTTAGPTNSWPPQHNQIHATKKHAAHRFSGERGELRAMIPA
jgi:hypothetical protein